MTCRSGLLLFPIVLLSQIGCTEAPNGDAGPDTQREAVPIIHFSPVEAPATPAPQMAQTRASFVEGNITALRSAVTSGRPFSVSLFNRKFDLEPVKSKRATAPNAWIGRIADAPSLAGGSALIILSGEDLYLRFYTEQRGYEVTSQQGAGLLATEVDVQALPDESEPEVEPPEEATISRSVPGDNQQQRIEVLLLYDKDLKAKLDKIPNGLANFVIDRQRRLDQVYLDGANRLGVNLVIKTHALYTGPRSFVIEDQSKFLRDWSQFKPLREKHGVDLIALVVNRIDGSCGIAPVLGVRSTTDYACEYKWTVAHEIGHNLGAQHQRKAGNQRKTSCNYGYRVPGVARTIMAYDCKSGVCPRQPYFSDVKVKHGNTVMGRACGTTDGAQNALTVKKNIPKVAKYRPK